MADRSLHPLNLLSQDHPLALVFEIEDPFRMALERFEDLIHEAENETLRAYLWGLYDQRRVAIYSGAPH